MTLRDRIRRWWSPAKWRDEHPEVSDGEGFALDGEQRLHDTVETGDLVANAREAQLKERP